MPRKLGEKEALVERQPGEKVLSQASAELKIPRHKLHKWREEGLIKMPRRRQGRRTFWVLSESEIERIKRKPPDGIMLHDRIFGRTGGASISYVRSPMYPYVLREQLNRLFDEWQEGRLSFEEASMYARRLRDAYFERYPPWRWRPGVYGADSEFEGSKDP